MGLSQHALGQAIGCTFQQVHRYESGQNRISAGVLYEIAQHQGRDPGWYFEGYRPPERSASPAPVLLVNGKA